MTKRKAAFFDRDGTIITDVEYLSDINQINILVEVIDFFLFLQKAGYFLFVVTNQSGIARGFFDEDFVVKTHVYLQNLFASKGVFFKQFYYCPHHPEFGKKVEYKKDCFCRKPLPGMIMRAAEDWKINLSQSLMFGDKEKDIHAGDTAGCKSFYIQDVLAYYKKANHRGDVNFMESYIYKQKGRE